MKRLTAVLLAMLMLVSIGTFSPVAAAEGVVSDANYKIVDTCYSAKLGVYVAIAKDLRNQVTPGEILYSKTGDAWRSVRKLNSATHYANKPTQQNIVWWEKENKFVLIADTNVLVSDDGENWVINNHLSGSANSIITTNGEQLVINSRKTIRVYDSLDADVASKAFATEDIYGKTVAVTPPVINPDDSSLEDWEKKEKYIVMLQSAAYVMEKDEQGDFTVDVRSVGGLTGQPYDMVYIDKLKGWLIFDGKAGLKFLAHKDFKITKLNAVSLTDGATGDGSFTAADVSNHYILAGTLEGQLYVAPHTASAIGDNSRQWTTVTPGEGTARINEQIYSISAINNNELSSSGDKEAFFFSTAQNIYVAVMGDDGWHYYDTAKSRLALEGGTRIEIPETGMAETEITARSFNWLGQESGNIITSVDIEGPLPEGITKEKTENGLKITVSSEVSGHYEFTVNAEAKNGQKISGVLTVVDEDGIDIEGFDELCIPEPGEVIDEQQYKAVIIATDGKPMTSRAAEIEFDAASVPRGVTINRIDESSLGVIVSDSAAVSKLTLEAGSPKNSDNMMQKEIKIGPQHVAFAEISSERSFAVIPNEEPISIQYTVQLFDQIYREMPEEKYLWRIETESGSTPVGVYMKSSDDMLIITPQAYSGTITVIASAVSDSSVFAQSDFSLSYTDLRKLQEDVRTVAFGNLIEDDLVLPKEGKYGSVFTWKSMDKSLLEISGNKGIIKRPSRANEEVSLTLTAEREGLSQKKTFELTVKKADTLCTNGDFADGTYNGWEKKSEQTTRAILNENGKSVMQVVGDGVYQTLSFTNDSSYGFEAKVKAEAGSTIRLSSQKGGTLAVLTANGAYQDIKGSYDYTKQDKLFEEKVYLECDSVMTIDNLRVYEITVELDKVMTAVNKAEYSKKTEDITAAKEMLNQFYDLPIKDELLKKLDDMKESQGGSSSGGSGGGGGGGKGSKAPSSVAGNSGASAPALPEKVDDNYQDELDTYLLHFKDMKSHWARNDVEYMAELNLISGKEDGVFAPDDNISRAEFAALITRVMGLEQTAYENSFYDIVSEDWYSGYVQTVKSNNFMNGYDGLFRPEAAISREEIAKVIVEAYNSKTNGKTEKGGSLYFNDLSDISYWAYDYIVEAVNLGFINGVSEEIFAPREIATRAQAAVMLRRVYDKLHPAQEGE